ncbi:hypothetical protein AX16_001963 [Volvariella volvacea WC 439]|nr:hypothetical protein AX16_001963 [Volvariella volvacea WC 439]
MSTSKLHDIRRTLRLNNGVKMPLIGQGAWAPDVPEEQARVKGWISTAINAGFRHIDTALSYGTEKAVGDAIRESGIPREEFFVVTKLPWNHHAKVRESFEESLKNLDLDYIDLYLIHWPQYVALEEGNDHPKNPDGTTKLCTEATFNDSWAEVEKLLDTGKVRAIGVSNFSVKTLEQLFTTAKVTPAVNQVEMHPYLAQNELVDYCRKKGIAITAYSPSGWETVRNDPIIKEIARKYNATTNQVILAWSLARDIIIIPKSTKVERQKENLELPVLDAEDVAKISALDRNKRFCNYPDPVHGLVIGWTMEQMGW